MAKLIAAFSGRTWLFGDVETGQEITRDATGTDLDDGAKRALAQESPCLFVLIEDGVKASATVAVPPKVEPVVPVPAPVSTGSDASAESAKASAAADVAGKGQG